MLSIINGSHADEVEGAPGVAVVSRQVVAAPPKQGLPFDFLDVIALPSTYPCKSVSDWR